MAEPTGGFYCKDVDCRCHTGEELEHVRTPFPMEFGPMYCCNRCASSRQDYGNLANQNYMDRSWIDETQKPIVRVFKPG